MELNLSRLNEIALRDFADAPETEASHTDEVQSESISADTNKHTHNNIRILAYTQQQTDTPRLQREADQNKADRERAQEVYKTYQRNILTASSLNTEILKGIKAGESIYTLFLKAIKAISLMTSDTLLYDQSEADIKAIYGEGLLELLPLQMELEAVETRLQRLRQAYKEEATQNDSKSRIAAAIKAHETRAEALKNKLIN